MKWMPQKHVRRQTLQATNTFLYLREKTMRGCINMFQVIFVSPKFYSVFKRVRMYIVGHEGLDDQLVRAWI